MKLFNEGSVEAKITFSTRCTARCLTCLNQTITNHCDLEQSVFEKFIRELLLVGEVKLISFYSIGESYLNPGFVPMVEWAIPKLREKNIRTQIVTNGSLSRVIPRGIDDFFISFNAGTKKTYEQITHLSFDRVVGNIWYLYNSGEYKKAKNFQIHMLVFEDNRDEVIEFRRLFFGMKGVKLRLSYKYDNQHGESSRKGLHRVKKRIPCNYLTNKIVLYPDGRIVLCSHDFLGSVVFGDLKKESLQDVLGKPERINMVNEHNSGVFEGICTDCNYNIETSGQNLFVYYDADPQEEIDRLKSTINALERNLCIRFLKKFGLIRQ